eukprot:544384-Prymnesium_polylepis.1
MALATAVATAMPAGAGTAAYKAPEQFDEDEITTKSEVYSFAIVLWELLHGDKPWSGKNELFIMRQVCDRELRPAMGEA